MLIATKLLNDYKTVNSQ